MRVLHLSDLHLSRFGESVRWTPTGDEDDAEVLHVWRSWRIEGLRSTKRRRPDKLRLVDPQGVIHKVRGWPKRDDRAIQALLSLAMERHRTSAHRLIRHHPSAEDLQALLQLDPVNTNLRFLQMLQQVLPLDPDVILLTGDITDNGFGYRLVTHYLAPWVERGRLLAVPGNHDTYEMFPGRGRQDRRQVKEQRYGRFAEKLGLVPGETGAWLRRIEDVVFVGLDSCNPPRTLLSASGAVTTEQLAWLQQQIEHPVYREARLRVGLVHHHLLRMPFAVGKRNPIEMTMRLRNAAEVMEACRRARVDILYNGHRHHGYLVQLPAHPTVISSPSSTRGCKFAKSDYVWLSHLGGAHPHTEMHPFEGYRADAATAAIEPDEE
jgi:3',5'-cyclic AMP phosphodiesterase CpdA